jgi:citrate synthase
VVLPLVASRDLAAYGLRTERIAQTGAKILNLMVTVVGDGDDTEATLAERLQRIWAGNVESAAYLLNAAMVLCADHELNVSAFTARCVASAGSTPYQVVLAGLAALQGIKHGGYVSRVEAFLREVGEPNRARMVIGERLKRGEPIPGFGHRLYAGGDPRGRLLLELIEENLPETTDLVLGKAVVETVKDLTGQYPTIDMGLGMLSRVLDLPAGAGIALFAMGRTIGWIGHAMEQYALDQIIRPRARYVGESP